MFYGRKDELNELRERYNSDKFEMGIIYGARRIGKTSLIKESLNSQKGLYFQAKESNEYDNRLTFSKIVCRLLGLPYDIVYPTFTEAFEAIIGYAENNSFVIAIDEIAYLAYADKGFLSELQYCIDAKFKSTKIKLILSGSNISFMNALLGDKRAPLFQRSTFQIHVTKLSFSEATLFLEGLSMEEKLLYLSLFGEHPFYLEMINKNKSFNDNIEELLFSKYGSLLEAPDKILPSSSSDQAMYNTILKAIAHRKRSNQDIALYVHKPVNYVAAYLPKLIVNETIEKREAFNRSQKLNYYEISDNLIKFWYRFIFDNQDIITLGMGHTFFNNNKKEIYDFLAQGMEDVVISYLTELNVKGQLGDYYEPIRNYKVDNSKLGHSIELDGLAKSLSPDNQNLLVLECKYRDMPFDLNMLNHLKENMSIFDTYETYDYYLFSKSGFSNDILSLKDNHLHLISLDNLFNKS